MSYGEQQRYILSEEDVRGLDERKQFLVVNTCKPILADQIRYGGALLRRAGRLTGAPQTCEKFVALLAFSAAR